MSTRITLWYSDEYHLYQEAYDDESVYLEIGSEKFEQLILKIPLSAWKEMRQHTIQPNERYLDLTDLELRAEAEREVDAHRATLDEMRAKGGNHLELRMMLGSFTFGSPDSSRAEMIERFVQTYRRSESVKASNET